MPGIIRIVPLAKFRHANIVALNKIHAPVGVQPTNGVIVRLGGGIVPHTVHIRVPGADGEVMSCVPGSKIRAQNRRIPVHRLAGNAPHNMNTKAQTQRMAIVRNGAKALAPGCAGEAVFRRQQTTVVVHTNRGKIVVLIALCLRLVPLNVAHQGVPPIGQQVRRHKAGVLPQGFLRYAGAVAVPAVPPHRRGGCKCLFHTVHLKKAAGNCPTALFFITVP